METALTYLIYALLILVGVYVIYLALMLIVFLVILFFGLRR